MPTPVQHDTEQCRFVITIGADECVLHYQRLSESSVDFYRTFVPFAQRGQGHAERLVAAGLAWAEQQSYDILSSCWYVERYRNSVDG